MHNQWDDEDITYMVVKEPNEKAKKKNKAQFIHWNKNKITEKKRKKNTFAHTTIHWITAYVRVYALREKKNCILYISWLISYESYLFAYIETVNDT